MENIMTTENRKAVICTINDNFDVDIGCPVKSVWDKLGRISNRIF